MLRLRVVLSRLHPRSEVPDASVARRRSPEGHARYPVAGPGASLRRDPAALHPLHAVRRVPGSGRRRGPRTARRDLELARECSTSRDPASHRPLVTGSTTTSSLPSSRACVPTSSPRIPALPSAHGRCDVRPRVTCTTLRRAAAYLVARPAALPLPPRFRFPRRAHPGAAPGPRSKDAWRASTVMVRSLTANRRQIGVPRRQTPYDTSLARWRTSVWPSPAGCRW